ncbi:ABC transporter permease [Streptococcus didelphis]|uniref:ABC transporter permease n=1 Tax=Streptococcus didelphis TaxID=102886 RepID=A0ABY9LG82_9STRE|nr:ABC transporter permease [Streptococcus didelphis]WMB27909.1 ABC transporter permease [Streptococcus didelphis]WMB29620.1 ABC transporter permease [Streptococcus didelphis]
MADFFAQYGSRLLVKTWEQTYISALALAFGALVAIPLGIILTRFPRLAKIVIGIASMLQTIPSLALLAMMIPIFGVGKLPAILALFIYSLLPILRNTFVGLNNVNSDLKDSAKGMGLSSVQSIFQVELPLAMPVIMAGVRLSAIYVIAWATLASYIGAGGLGDLIFSGLNLFQPELIIGGTIPVIILSLVSDFLLGSLEKHLLPKQTSGVKA